MRSDAYGLPVSTADPEALAFYDRAVHALLSWHADALSLFRAAVDKWRREKQMSLLERLVLFDHDRRRRFWSFRF